jgi:shikimate kinase
VLGWDFYDLDNVIENEEGKTVVEIFEQNGEAYFRKIENERMLKLAENENVIISLGGGTISYKDNLKLLKSAGKIVYLKVKPAIIYKRIRNKIDRPLFRDLVLGENSEQDFLDKIESLMNERSGYYEQADIVINTDENPVGITVDNIVRIIKKMIYEKN